MVTEFHYHFYPKKAILRLFKSPNVSARGTLKISPVTLSDKWGKLRPRKVRFLVTAMSQLMVGLRKGLSL